MAQQVLDLFSGIGGFSLGLERAGFKTIAFCEIDEFCQKVLRKHWPDTPIYSDIRELNDVPGRVDVVCGGYPCQPFSSSGLKRGEADDRHLWPEMLRIIKRTKPTWVICENVTGHIRVGLDDVLLDLETIDYATQSFVIPSCAVGCHQRRDRVWILAHANGGQSQVAWDLPGGRRVGLQAARDFIGEREDQPSPSGVVDGIPNRMDRLRALGNSVTPHIPEMIGRMINGTQN